MWLLIFRCIGLLVLECTCVSSRYNQSDLDKCLDKVIQHAHSDLIFYFEDDVAAESFCREVNISVTCAKNYSFSIFRQTPDQAYQYAAQRMAQIYLDETRNMRNLIYRDHNLREDLKYISCQVSFEIGIGYNCDFYKDRLKSILESHSRQDYLFSFSAHDLVLRCVYSVVQKKCGKIATDFWAQTMNNYVINKIKEQCYMAVESRGYLMRPQLLIILLLISYVLF